MKKILRISIFGLLLSLVLVSAAAASTINGKGWYNELSSVHSMQVWVTNPDVSIKNVKFKKGTLDGWSWNFVGDSKSSVILSGPATASSREVIPDFEFTAPRSKTDFSVEWAEIGDKSILTGTNSYDGKRWSYTQGEISNTPTPIPGALLIFGGGLSVLGLIRRRFSRS